MGLSEHPRVAVVGSVNMDLVARADRVPAPGETVLGGDFTTIPGGKGANQAVAAARLGAQCHLIGAVGEDAFGAELRARLEEAGVNVEHLATVAAPTGVAMIVVDEVGENAICVAAGANAALTPQHIDRAEGVIAASAVCLLQLETPIETVEHALRVARRHGVETILDPAPAPAPFPPALFQADILTPNLIEAETIASEPGDERGNESRTLAACILAAGARSVVITLGPRGALLAYGNSFEHVPGLRVVPVDTTGAGDAFVGGLAVARAAGDPLAEAVLYANAAGAVACTSFGAQPSMPTRRQVNDILGAG